MRQRLFHRSQREWLAGILLVALAFRGLVPDGFMPASGRPFTLEICRAGFLAPIDSHALKQHPGSPSQFEHCPFGMASSAGPISDLRPLQPVASIVTRIAARFEPLRLSMRLQRTQQARAPPDFA